MEDPLILILVLSSSLPFSSPLFSFSFFPSLPPASFSVDFPILFFTSREINRPLWTFCNHIRLKPQNCLHCSNKDTTVVQKSGRVSSLRTTVSRRYVYHQGCPTMPWSLPTLTQKDIDVFFNNYGHSGYFFGYQGHSNLIGQIRNEK